MLHFVRCRRNFSTHLKDSNCGLTGARYFRLMSMAVALMTWALIVTVVDMWFRYQSGWQPWNNWAEVHSHFSLIKQLRTLDIPEVTVAWTFAFWWSIPLSSVIFFAFFSFGEDAVKEYRACLLWIRRNILRRTVEQSTANPIGSLSSSRYTLSSQSNRSSLMDYYRTPIPQSPSSSTKLTWNINSDSNFKYGLDHPHVRFAHTSFSEASTRPLLDPPAVTFK